MSGLLDHLPASVRSEWLEGPCRKQELVRVEFTREPPGKQYRGQRLLLTTQEGYQVRYAYDSYRALWVWEGMTQPGGKIL